MLGFVVGNYMLFGEFFKGLFIVLFGWMIEVVNIFDSLGMLLNEYFG